MLKQTLTAVRAAFATSLRPRVLALTAVIFVALAIPAYLSFVHIVDSTVLKLGTLFAEKQVQYDRYRGLETLMREVALAETLARAPAVLEWAADEGDPLKRARGLAELEHYRLAFKDRSYFFVIDASGNYYFNDAADSYAGEQHRYRLSRDNPRDGWYYTTVAQGPGCQLNVDHDDNLAVTKVWINCVVERDGRTLGIIGTGLDLSTFISEVVNSDQLGVESLFVDRSGAVQASRDAGRIDFHSLTKDAENRKTVFQMVDGETGRSRLAAMLREASGSEGLVAADFIEIGGHRMLAGVGYLDKLGWYNVTLMRVDEIIDRRLFLPIAALLFVMMASAVALVTWLFKRSVLDRLALAERSVRRVEHGDYHVEAADPGNDEIGRLSRALAAMAAAVREHTGNLEAAVRERTQQLERIAFVDPLSGIANRRGFSESFEQAMRRARRRGVQSGILLLDIDRFKSLNDNFGHTVGDEIVIEAARRVQGTLREGDVCGRWGGDEFVVLINDCDLAALQSAALRVLNAFRTRPFVRSDGVRVRLTTSVGAYLLTPADSLESAIGCADLALYAAKEGGRNRLTVFDPLLHRPQGFKVA